MFIEYDYGLMARIAGAESLDSNCDYWFLTMHIQRSLRPCDLVRGGAQIYKNNASLEKNLNFFSCNEVQCYYKKCFIAGVVVTGDQ